MTYLEAVNKVLRRLREREVSSVTESTYSKLIGEIRDSFRLQINIGIRSPIEAPSESGQETDR